MPPLTTILTQARDTWQGLNPGRRTSLIVSTLLGIAVVLGTAFFVMSESYAPLMTNLSSEDAAQVTAELQTRRIPYRLAAGGSAVLVPEDKVLELRLQMAGAGLPKGGGIGFEVFDSASFGMSRFAEKLNYRRGLEGELRRTIRSMGPVREARVHLAIPESALFTNDQRRPTASVSLQMHPGRRLSGEQTQAVVHLVAASVEGLAPQDVTVVDDTGSVLARGGGEATSEMDLERRRALSREYEGQVAAILEKAVGVGRSSVRVSVDLDPAHIERTTESFDPDSAVLRSEQLSEEESSRADKNAEAGVPGSRSNLAGTGGPSGGESQNAGKKKRETRNYELSKTISREVAPQGRLRKLSVAVVVDTARDKNEEGQEVSRPRSAEELATLTDLVKKAVGYDARRGDEVTVQSVPFDIIEAEVEPAWTAYLALLDRLWRPIAALVFVVGVVAWLMRRRRGSELQLLAVPRTVRELEATVERGEPALQENYGRAAPALAPTRQDPDRAAAVLKGWLAQP